MLKQAAQGSGSRYPWRYLRDVDLIMLMVGLDDLKGHFQPKEFYKSLLFRIERHEVISN